METQRNMPHKYWVENGKLSVNDACALKNESIEPDRFVKALNPNIHIPKLLEEYLQRTLQPWIVNYIN